MTGAVLLGLVVAGALRRTDPQEFVRLAGNAEPWWLLVAVLLQAGTYLAQGAIWRSVCRRARFPLSLGGAYALSLAKLFVDQALPSGGVSGMVVVARSLEYRGMRRAAVMAGVVVVTASYYLTYASCLAIALLVLSVRGVATVALAVTALLFAAAAVWLAGLLVRSAGRRPGATMQALARFRVLHAGLNVLRDADPELVRDPRLLCIAGGNQMSIALLDAATVWVLIRGLGATASPDGVFASFMFSTLFRTLGVLPGGLGTFEAMSVVTLRMAGVPIPVALSATLLFRGLSFWLPMLPGVWCARHALRRRGRPRHP
jgi:Mg2+-importing ATPase